MDINITFSLSTYLKLATAVIKKIKVALIHIGPHLKITNFKYKSGLTLAIFKKSGLNGRNVA